MFLFNFANMSDQKKAIEHLRLWRDEGVVVVRGRRVTLPYEPLNLRLGVRESPARSP